VRQTSLGSSGAENTHHGSGLVKINLIRLQLRLLVGLIWILWLRSGYFKLLEGTTTYPAVNLELLHQDRLLLRRGLPSSGRG